MPHWTRSERREPACVQARLSIVFAGHPGAGKTTLMSCTAAELDLALRVVVAEEVFEADIRVRPTVSVSGNA
jgi:pilus assembly protein CpaF